MKVPSIVSEAKRALSEEFAVVIGLQTTGEVRKLDSSSPRQMGLTWECNMMLTWM